MEEVITLIMHGILNLWLFLLQFLNLTLANFLCRVPWQNKCLKACGHWKKILTCSLLHTTMGSARFVFDINFILLTLTVQSNHGDKFNEFVQTNLLKLWTYHMEIDMEIDISNTYEDHTVHSLRIRLRM